MEHGPASAGHLDGSAPIIVRPDDPRYPDLVVGNNTRWAARPDYVRIVQSTEDTVRAVQEAMDAGTRMSVKGGGHCYADFVFNDEVRVVIDTGAMNSVSYDDALGVFCVGGGATLLDVYQELFKRWGVTVPGGMCYSVGVGGHVSGGGFGLLSRRDGLSADHLYGVEVVVVDAGGRAHAVVATCEPDDPHRDLWWAHTGGGGGNFGVVTRYLFRSPGTTGRPPSQQLVTPPETVLVSALSVPWTELSEDRFAAVVEAYGAWHARNTSPDAPEASLCSILSLNHEANGSIGLLTQMDATLPGADVVLSAYLREVVGPLGPDAARPMSMRVGEHGPLPELFTPQRLPWLTSVKLLGATNPTLSSPVLRSAQKSAYLRRPFTAGQIAAMRRNLTRTDPANPSSMVVLYSYGARVNTVGPQASASAQRDSILKTFFESYWQDPGGDEANVAWTRAVYNEVFASTGGYPVPGDATDGCYINFPDMDINDPTQNTTGVPWHTLYYKDNYPRLQQVKARYDPLDVFRHNQGVEPPGPAAAGGSAAAAPHSTAGR
jgi:FAD/FMN-containing dehydrogenase